MDQPAVLKPPASGAWIGRLRHGCRLLRALCRIPSLPRATIRLDPAANDLYRAFTRPHDHLLVVPQKRWGVAMLAMPHDRPAWLKGRHRQAVRTNIHHAEHRGYAARSFDPRPLRQAVDAIHRSAPHRQGRALRYDHDADERQIAGFPGRYDGVFAADGALVAVACTRDAGEVAVLTTCIGHADHLAAGIMYLLMARVVERCAAERGRGRGRPYRFLMYEGYFGQPAGQRYFLDRLGFAPWNVRWRLGA